MKKFGELFKTLLMGGFGILFPLLLFYLLAAEIFGLVVALATPIADSIFPAGYLDDVEFPILVVLAIILILFISLLIGAIARSKIGNRCGEWIERNTIGKLPLYTATKFLSKGFTGTEHFRPALLTNSDTEWEIVYIIEDHGNGKLTVLVPWAPASIAGSVKIVTGDRVELMETNLGIASRALSHWGVGLKDLMPKCETGSK
jgi:uncharacterized membrane protein